MSGNCRQARGETAAHRKIACVPLRITPLSPLLGVRGRGMGGLPPATKGDTNYVLKNPRDYVGDALDVLRDGLGPYVLQRLQDALRRQFVYAGDGISPAYAVSIRRICPMRRRRYSSK